MPVSTAGASLVWVAAVVETGDVLVRSGRVVAVGELSADAPLLLVADGEGRGTEVLSAAGGGVCVTVA